MRRSATVGTGGEFPIRGAATSGSYYNRRTRSGCSRRLSLHKIETIHQERDNPPITGAWSKDAMWVCFDVLLLLTACSCPRAFFSQCASRSMIFSIVISQSRRHVDLVINPQLLPFCVFCSDQLEVQNCGQKRSLRPFVLSFTPID